MTPRPFIPCIVLNRPRFALEKYWHTKNELAVAIVKLMKYNCWEKKNASRAINFNIHRVFSERAIVLIK